jgi:hypothetical protein
MHELSMSMGDVAREEAELRRAPGVEVYLKLGPLSGVTTKRCWISYEIACHESPPEASRLVIEEVPIVRIVPPVSSTDTFSRFSRSVAWSAARRLPKFWKGANCG